MDNSVRMDQELAKKLLLEGGTLILLDLPEGTEFGIDLKSWNTGYKFKGVKMIPPGLHMVYYNISTKYGDVAPRASFIHDFKKSEILVKKWNPDLEEIVINDPSEEELSRLKSNLFNLDQFLGPYPFDIWDKWKNLIKNVTDNLVIRVTPECGVIRSALDLVCDVESKDRPGTSGMSSGPSLSRSYIRTNDSKTHETMDDSVLTNNNSSDLSDENSEIPVSSTTESRSASEVGVLPRRRKRKDIEASLLPNLKPTPGTELKFTVVPEDLFPPGSTPADITKHSIDPTFTLDTLLSSMDNDKELIGEIELSFVCFLVGLSLDALEAWKELVILVCRCERAITQRPGFYTLLFSTLHTQLQHIPEDFLVDIVESENAVYSSLRNVFRSILTGEGVDARLRKTSLTLSQKLSERFGWDFSNLEEEDEDEAPVVVDLENYL